MAVVFKPNQAVANITAMAQVQRLHLHLDGRTPELPISSAHMVMAYAYALGALGTILDTAKTRSHRKMLFAH